MGRPKVYDERTRAALLDAAEQLVAEAGLEALSVRSLARATGTTIRAVYALFGSKDGLLVALGTRAFQLLSDGMDSLPTTDDPSQDLVDAGVMVFRRFTLNRPALFAVGILQTGMPTEIASEFLSAQEKAFARLLGRIGRLKQAGKLGTRREAQAALAFHALCEGLAAIETRGNLRSDSADRIWSDALGALVAGWAAIDQPSYD